MSSSLPVGTDRRALMLRIVEWLVERHHQSLGLWPWVWSGPDGEPYVTLYAVCTAQRFGRDFGALANWIEAHRWPPVDDTPHPATLYRDRIGAPAWSLAPPLADAAVHPRAVALDIEQLARGGAPIETLAQLLESASRLDQYLALLAPQRHGGHPHRAVDGAMAVLVMRLATEVALALDDDYAIPWSGPVGGQANGISDPDWAAFQARYQLDRLPFEPAAQAVFSFGERGWFHAGGYLGDRRGTVVRLGPATLEPAAFASVRAQALALLSD
jgi:hypothetical protein